MMVDLWIPMETPNITNQRVHWAVKAKQAKSQRGKVARRMPPVYATITEPALVVRFTRSGRRRLDDDGLRAALKSVRDQVASWLRIDDASPLVRWEYAQEAGEPGVRIEVLRRGT